MIRFLITLLTLNCIFSAIQAQLGYISTVSKTSSGIQIIDRGAINNSKGCAVRRGDSIIVYSPKELAGYGFNNGLNYVSFKVVIENQPTQLFLELIQDGEIKQYKLRGTKGNHYFITKGDSNLIELVKTETTDPGSNSFREILKSYTHDFGKLDEAITIMRFCRSNITEILKRYNQKIDKPFPFISYGVFVQTGIASPKFSTFDLFKDSRFNLKPVLSANIFITIPINYSAFSFQPELQFQHYSGYSNCHVSFVEYDVNLSFSCLRLPLLIRYLIPIGYQRFYIEAGPLYSINFNSKNIVFKSINSGSEIEVDNYNYTESIDKHFGMIAGIGMKYPFWFGSHLLLGLRYQQIFSSSSIFTYDFKGIYLVTGISF